MKSKLILFFLLSTTVLVNAQPANDNCENAQEITVTTSFQVINFEISDAQIENESACQGSETANYADVWFSFIMPVSGNLNINGSLSYNRFALYDACGGIELNCFQTQSVLNNLEEGEVYFLRVFRSENQTALLNQVFYIQAFETPDNDICADSLEIFPNSTPQTVSFSIGGAETNNEAGCLTSGEDDYADIWYDFFMPINGILHIESLSDQNNFAIYNMCDGTEITCFSKEQNTPYLMQGFSYKLRVFRSTTNAISGFGLNFNIYTSSHLTNDICSEAIPYAVSTTSEEVFFDVTQALPINELGCSDGNIEAYVDVWYQLTLPANGELFIESDSTDNQFAIYDTCNGTQLSCFSGSGSLTGLLQNQMLELRVFRESSLALSNQQSFDIYMIEIFTNDTCEDAEVILVDETYREYSIDLLQSTLQTEVGCVGEPTESYADEWFEFTMPIDGKIYINGNFDYNRFAIYDACGGNQIHCFSERKIMDGLVQGQIYKLRVYRPAFAYDLPNQVFRIRALENLENDICSNAQPLATLSTDVTLVTFDMYGATIGTDFTCDGLTEDNIADAWFEFTMPYEGNLFVDTQHGVAVYDACNGNELYCNPLYFSVDSFKLVDNLTAGETYKLRISGPEDWIYSYDFQSISVRAYPRAANDECVNTEIIPSISIDAENPTEVEFYTFGSLINNEVGCAGDVAEDHVDVWYGFTMPSDGVLNIESYQYNRFAIYDACNGNQIDCFAGSGQIENLSANQTYILRVFQRQSEMFHPFANFDIWASETLGIPSENAFNSSMKLIGNNSLLIQNLNTPASLELYNIMGQKLRSESLNPASNQYLELTEPTGIYFAKLISENGSKTLKMVIRN